MYTTDSEQGYIFVAILTVLILILVVYSACAGHHVATLDCGSYSSFVAPSFTPAAANPEITVWNQLSIRINVHQVTSPGQSPRQRMTISGGVWMDSDHETAGLWFVTDNDNINVLPLSNIEACYYVIGTGDDIIIAA